MKKALVCLLLLVGLVAEAQTTPTFPVGNLTASGTIISQGSISTQGNIGATGTGFIGGNATVGGTLGVTGGVTGQSLSTTGNVTSSAGNLSASGTVTAGGNAIVGGNLQLSGTPGALGQVASSNGTLAAGWKTLTSIFDGVYCATVGQILVRTIGAWTCASTQAANPVWFGADPSGAADSTTAVNNALAATSNVQLPPGNFKISSLSLQTNGINFRGSGPGATVLSPSTTTGDFITVGTAGTNINDVQIRNFSIVAATARSSGALIHIFNGHYIYVEKFVLAGTYFDGIVLEGGAQQFEYHITDFDIQNPTDIGIIFGANGLLLQDVYVRDGNISGAHTAGLDFVEMSGGVVENVDIILAGTGVNFFPGTGGTVSFMKFINVQADTSTGAGWNFISNGGSILNTQMIACWGSSSGTAGVNLNTVNLNGLNIIGGDYINNQGSGILLTALGSGVLIEGATVAYNSQSASAGGPAIGVAAGVSNFSIIGNQLGAYGTNIGGTNKQSYGVSVIPGGSTQYIISLNRADGNVTGTILDGGTGTTKFVGNNI